MENVCESPSDEKNDFYWHDDGDYQIWMMEDRE